MNDINIQTSNDANEVAHYFRNNFNIEVGMLENGVNFCRIQGAKKEKVSEIIADYIINNFEEKLITRIVKKNYDYLNSKEKKEVLSIANKTSKNKEGQMLENLMRLKRKRMIEKSLTRYLETTGNIMIDGFVNFRLNDYIKELEELTEKSVDEYLVEKEYKEFINLLKYFVNIQESTIEKVHVVYHSQDEMYIYDSQKNNITDKCISEFAKDCIKGKTKAFDIVLSSLVSLSPKKIVLHGVSEIKGLDFAKTINAVFENRVYICRGCFLCE